MIIIVLILYVLSLGCIPQAFAESPQTKAVLPSTKTDTNKEKQSLDEQKAAFFLKAFGKKIPETFHPHEMKVILDQKCSHTNGCGYQSIHTVPKIQNQRTQRLLRATSRTI